MALKIDIGFHRIMPKVMPFYCQIMFKSIGINQASLWRRYLPFRVGRMEFGQGQADQVSKYLGLRIIESLGELLSSMREKIFITDSDQYWS
jgi:hypothetical protein